MLPNLVPRLSGEILNDEMSLSSLSSGDEKILNADGSKIEMDDSQAPTSFSSHFYPPPNYSANDPYFAWRGMYGNNYSQPGAYPSGTNNAAFPSFSYPPPNGYSGIAEATQPTSVPLAQGATIPDQTALDPHAATIE